MPPPQTSDEQLKIVAKELYTQALQLTLANPLLRFRADGKNKKFLSLTDENFSVVLDAMARQRPLRLVGKDLGEFEAQLVKQSQQANFQGSLRVQLQDSAKDVDTRLRSFFKLHEDLLEKRGLPCAYLAAGFLEWISDDETVTKSPLLLIPIDVDECLDQQTRTRTYEFNLSDRPILLNPALGVYLKDKYNIVLPSLPPEIESDANSITRWLVEKATLITASKTSWKITKQIAVGIFDCGAVAADCDPASWNSLEDYKVLSKLFLSGTPPTIHRPPAAFMPNALVMAADGSQLAAIDIVSDGTSVVIHGPPGSGKSQTIVNLIAQAFSQGKSVLFVAQKPEAAHVVYKRLSECGLSQFCVQLVPSGETRNMKKAVLDGLRTRLQFNPPSTPQINQQKFDLERSINKLDAQAASLAKVLPQFDLNAREIVAQLAVLASKQVQSLAAADIVAPSTVSAFAHSTNSLNLVCERHRAISPAAFKDLSGIEPIDATRTLNDNSTEFIQEARVIENNSIALQTIIHNLKQNECSSISHNLNALEVALHAAPKLEPTVDANFLQRCSRLKRPGADIALQRMIRTRAVVREACARIPDARQACFNVALPSAADGTSLRTLADQFAIADRNLGWLIDLLPKLDELALGIDKIEDIHADSEVATHLLRASDFQEWHANAKLIVAIAAPHDGRSFLAKWIPIGKPLPTLIANVAAQSQELHNAKQLASDVTIIERIPECAELKIVIAYIASANSFRLRVWKFVTSPEFRLAHLSAKSTLLPNVLRSDWGHALKLAMEYKKSHEAWTSIVKSASCLQECPTTPNEWGAASAWLSSCALQMQTGYGTPNSIWPLLREFETEGSQGMDAIKIGKIARFITSTTWLSNGFSQLFKGQSVRSIQLANSIRELRKLLQLLVNASNALGFRRELSASETIEHIRTLVNLREEISSVNADSDSRALFGEDFEGIDTETIRYEEAHSWLTASMSAQAGPWKRWIDWMISEQSLLGKRSELLRDFSDGMRKHLPILLDATEKLSSHFAFQYRSSNLKFWRNDTLTEAISKSQAILRHEREIPNLLALSTSIEQCKTRSGSRLMELFGCGHIAPEFLVSTYQRTCYENALRSDSSFAPIINFDQLDTDQCIAKLPKLDTDLRLANAKEVQITLSNKEIPEGNRRGFVASFTEMGLINHLVGQQRPRWELQSFMSRAGNALLALQPCIIATPATVSECLPRDKPLFDLLIIDEASQLPPSSAFGSLARAKQVVIVGDPKQLPPTDFFQSQIHATTENDEVEQDSTGLADAKSILDRAIGALQNVHLRGHYRSRHHSLINFSSKHFYENRLVIAPSISPRNLKFGVLAHYFQNATYADRTNETEAIEIAKAAMKHFLSGTDETLGIVAFNAPQAQLIDTHLESLARKNQENFDAYARFRNQKDPLFIRNLESVQGDERDVIFISYTFGKNAQTGVIAQNFGPILRENGERRLNVLITRARNRVEVFHSLLPTEITSESRGPSIMRLYLDYARQAPSADFADGDCESDFEKEVKREIELISPTIRVRPQVGCAGFRIDLGVCLTHEPDRFLLGIECDGAAYHSSTNARDRDLIRQRILEHNGWKIHRVWSTAWWKNHTYEMQRLKDAVKKALNI